MLPGSDSDPNDLNITSWNVTSKIDIKYIKRVIEMEPRKITIKVAF